MISKKGLLSLSLIGTIIFSFFIFLSAKGLCSYNFCSRPHDDSLATLFLPFFSIFIISIITYKMREEVYRAWFKFARIWIPLSLVLIFITPEYSEGLVPLDRGSVSFFLSVVFLVISLVIIIYKSFKLKNK